MRRCFSTGLRHRAQAHVVCSQRRVFELVSDVDNYHNFLPFCTHSRVVTRHSDRYFEADMAIGFGVFTESYRSHVTLDPYSQVDITAADSTLFSTLHSSWRFHPVPDGGCNVTFEISMKAKSHIHTATLSLVFDDIATKQLMAFKEQCSQMQRQKQLTGNSSSIQDHTAQTVLRNVNTTYENLLHEKNSKLFSEEDTEKILNIVGSLDRFHADEFHILCRSVAERDRLFSRYRDRAAFLAFGNDRELCRRVFATFAHDESGRIDEIELFLQLYKWGCASPLERLMMTIRRLGNCQLTVYADVLTVGVREHFDIQLEVLRTAIPAMILKNANDENEKASQALRTLGIVTSVIGELDTQLKAAIKSTESFASSGQRIDMDMYIESWKSQKELVAATGIEEVSQLIRWAQVVDQ